MNITKGNWYAVENNYYVDIMVKGNPIAQVIENEFIGTDKDAMRANAKLMECAPKVYEALQRTNEELAFVIDRYNKKVKDPANFIDAQTCHENQMLLAKARGES